MDESDAGEDENPHGLPRSKGNGVANCQEQSLHPTQKHSGLQAIVIVTRIHNASLAAVSGASRPRVALKTLGGGRNTHLPHFANQVLVNLILALGNIGHRTT